MLYMLESYLWLVRDSVLVLGDLHLLFDWKLIDFNNSNSSVFSCMDEMFSELLNR